MKLARLKKKVFVESGIIASVVVVLAIISFVISGYVESLNRDFNRKKANISQLHANVEKIEGDVKKATDSKDLFVKLQNPSYKVESIDRDAIKTVFDKLQKQYDLAGLKIKIKPVEDSKNPDFNKTSVLLAFSQIDLEISAISDDDILSFVDSLRKELPGIIHINKINVIRKGEISETSLAQVRNGIVPELVTGNVSFYWFAFKTVAPAAATVPPGTAVPPVVEKKL